MDSHETISTRGKYFHCDLCDVKIASDQAVKDHLQGKKHKRLTAIKTSRQKQAECSIFVGGLTKLVSELELTDYFAKYGSVAQVIVDKDKGKYAIVEFSENSTAEKAAEVEKQTMNGKKITVRPRECKPVATKSKQHVSHGKQAKTAREKELDALLERLTEEENVCSQITTLMEETCLDQSDLQLRYLICDLIHEVFVEVIPKCRVFPYGSSVSGFGVKGCDLDLQVDLGHDVEQFRYHFASMPMETSKDEGGEDMDTNEEDMEHEAGASPNQPDTSSMSSEDILALLCRLLKQCVPSCQHVRVIPSSRRPVIKFIHKESGLHCDLSLDNRLALRNTELLNFYSCLDPRIRPLVFAVRLWAKQHQLAGNQLGPGPKLTNYALTMLVVHYLQNTQPQMLPTLQELRQLADSGEHVTVDGWNCSFTTDATKIQRLGNADDVESLLKGFFSFYTKYDFATSVLCPATGSTTTLTQFLQEPQSVPSQDASSRESSREFKVGPVNIQDPLELTHNVSANVNEKVADKLRAELRKADLTCISLRYRKQGALDPETGRVPRWGFLSLLEERDAGTGKGRKENTHSIIIPLKMSQVTQEFMKSFQDEMEMKTAWCQHVEDFAQRLIVDVLGLECSAVEPQTMEDDAGESSMQTTPQKQDIAVESPAKDDVSTEGDGGASGGSTDDTANSESGTTKGNSLTRNRDEEEQLEEPTPKRQRLSDSSVDVNDHHDMSMTSSGDTSVTSVDNLTSPTSSSKDEEVLTGHTRTIICKTSHAVWMGRRKLRRKLQSEKPWGDATIDEVTREKYITEELIKSTPSGSEDKTEFKLVLRRKLESDLTAVVLTFCVIRNEGNVSNFRHFFEEFLSKMLSHSKV